MTVIHVVQKEESITDISKKFAIDKNMIMSINRIHDDNSIVPGQSILIPINDNKYTNCEKCKTIEVNAFINAPYDTMKSTPDINKSNSSVDNSYIQNKISNNSLVVKNHAPYLTYLSIFGYSADINGNIRNIDDYDLISTALDNNVTPLMVFTNYYKGIYEPCPFFNIVNDEKKLHYFINKIAAIIKRKGYKGINMDFKNLHPKYKSVYFNFIYKLSRLIQNEKLKVSACLNGEDMININNNSFLSATNFEILMPYRWGWIKSPPMPVVPLNQLEKLLHRTVSAFPPKNIMLDLPLFGYDWTLPYHLHKNPAKTVSSNDAINLAVSKNTCIHFDYVSGSPYYNYVDEYNNTHIVWFEDVQSLWVKYELACFMGLKGFSFWLCGYDFPLNWIMLYENFTIKK